MDSLEALEHWAEPLLQRLKPGERRALAKRIGVELRKSQQQRIAAQQNPDGSAYAPRKANAKGLRDKRGAIRRGAMFTKLRQARFLTVKADAAQISVGFLGRVARIARVHQEGLSDFVSPKGPRVRYERRELLGFTARDRDLIRDLLLEHLSK